MAGTDPTYNTDPTYKEVHIMSSPAVDPLPLTGIRVVDFVRGPLQGVGKTLADLGAEVLLVEPHGGSPARRGGVVHDGVSLSFEVLNRGKRSVVADPSSPDGRRRIDELLQSADLCLLDSGDSDGHATDWGSFADPEWLRRQYPALALVHISDFGRTGPRSSWRGTADVHSAVSTALSRSGLPSVEAPLLPPDFLAHGAAAAQAVYACLVALHQSIRTGAGEVVDFSVSEALMHVFDPVFGIGGTARAGKSMWDLPPGRPDAGHMYPVFRTRDGWVRICVLSPRQWAGMFEWLGRPARFADAKYAQTLVRYAEADELHPLIARLFAGLSRDEATELGHAHGVPTAAILSPREVLETDQFWESGSLSHSSAGAHNIIAPSGVYDLDGVRVGGLSPAPALDDAGDSIAGPRRRRARTHPGGHLPFEGLRVLDLGVIVVGGELGRLFADLGAEVIKIESRAFPDGSRLAGDMSESFAWGHRNKLSMGVNLKSDGGRETFAELVRCSDVVLTNFKPGTLDKLGFGYESLARLNPGIILSESSAYGNRGPWSTRMGYGPLVRASSGLSELWQYSDLEGSYSDAVTIYPDHAVARLNAAAIIALLLRRQETGRGGSVSTAQVDAILDAMSVDIALESVAPGSVRAGRSARVADAPRGVFRASGDDDWLVVDVGTHPQFRALATALGRSDWAADHRYATAAGRAEHAAELEAAVAEWAAVRSAQDAAQLLQSAGVPAGDMKRPPDLLTDPHLAERGAVGVLRQPQLGSDLPAFAAEAKFESVPPPLMAPAPSQGEHTRVLARRLLGWDSQRIQRAIEAGAIEAALEPAGGSLSSDPASAVPHAHAVARSRKVERMPGTSAPAVRIPLDAGDAVVAERRGHVLLVTINRPDARNAVSVAVARGIGEALERAEHDPDIRVVVLTGSGDLAFCAGQDLKEAAAGVFPDGDQAQRWGFAGYVRHAVSTPTIAAVNGFALGGGTEIVLASDLAVAAETATFGLPEVRRGIIAAAGGTFRLPRQIPSKVAMEAILTGRPITAARALELGLVNRVVPPERLLDEALALAEEIIENAPVAVQASKRIARGIDDGSYALEDEDWRRTERESRLVMTTHDAREGLQAFAQKRTPQWVGQ
jgi:crotonobetainyl-CoA:carnitine CoA-transferase CaiB-like acyl-CoA transferase/enoyl-CoA hydratase/carnithine racemase